MKIRETQTVEGGMGGTHVEFRIRELKKGEEKPEQATEMPDETPVCDWQPEV